MERSVVREIPIKMSGKSRTRKSNVRLTCSVRPLAFETEGVFGLDFSKKAAAVLFGTAFSGS
jgi:hypothetical protein